MDSLEINPRQAAAAATSQPKANPMEALAPADKHIWGIYIFLCIISIIELYSASSREVASSAIGVLGPVVRHIGMLAAGCVLIVIIQRIPYNTLIRFIKPFAFISVIMMVYVMVAGDIVNGARRSFRLAGITIQPSEFLKLSAVLVIARFTSFHMHKKGGVAWRGVILSAISVLTFGLLLIKQGMTNTVLLMAISVSMMLIAGIESRKLFLVLCVYGIFGIIGYLYTSSHDDKAVPATGQTELVEGASQSTIDRRSTWKARFDRYFDPTPAYERPLNAKNRQEQYSYMAQANGGVFGVFPGNSRETARLPLAFSDFIFAIIIEDMGLVGGIVVLVLYLWLLGRALAIAQGCRRALPALIVLGLAVMIVLQALSHMAIVTGVSPVSGQPLPLISKGGTSILITSLAFGVMLSVSRYAGRKNATRSQIKNEIEALPEEMRADNPSSL